MQARLPCGHLCLGIEPKTIWAAIHPHLLSFDVYHYCVQSSQEQMRHIDAIRDPNQHEPEFIKGIQQSVYQFENGEAKCKKKKKEKIEKKHNLPHFR